MLKSEINIKIDRLVKLHDKNKSFDEAKEAAENNDEAAQEFLALVYYKGEIREKNLEKAFYWFQKAADNGNIYVQYNLATLYLNGEGTEKNLEKGFYWIQKAA